MLDDIVRMLQSRVGSSVMCVISLHIRLSWQVPHACIARSGIHMSQLFCCAWLVSAVGGECVCVCLFLVSACGACFSFHFVDQTDILVTQGCGLQIGSAARPSTVPNPVSNGRSVSKTPGPAGNSKFRRDMCVSENRRGVESPPVDKSQRNTSH